MPNAVRTGLDVVRAAVPRWLRDARIGLVTSPAAIAPDFHHAVDILVEEINLAVVALFGPEHGLGGAAQAGDHVESTVDPRTGFPLYSLYGATRTPTAAMLEGIDLLLIDLPDIPVRYATYASTVFNLVNAAAEHGIALVLLDRPNALTGVVIQGNILDPAFRSFVGGHTVPIRHGLTLGELSRLYAREHGWPEPRVIAMEGWRREMWFDATGLPWVLPSPNMPTLDTVTLYPATCLIEGTNFSEGRGTTRPFEMIGAPWIDADALATSLRALSLRGIGIRPCSFVPTFSKHTGQVCHGVQLHITDREVLDTPALGVHLLTTARALDPTRFAWVEPNDDARPFFIDLLTGTDRLRHAIDEEISTEVIIDGWQAEAASFQERHAEVALYD